MRNILKQTSWLFLAQSLSRIIGFFYTLFLARNLGVESFGLFSAALTTFMLISTISELGFNRYLTREITLDSKKIQALLINVGFLRILLSGATLVILAIFLSVFDPDELRSYLIFLASFAVFPTSLAQTLDTVFVALRKLQFSAIASILTSIGTAGAGISLIMGGFGPEGPILAIIFGQILYFLILLIQLKFQNFELLSPIKVESFKKLLSGSLPYGILGALGLIYFRIDTIMLSYLRGNFETGIYSAAYKFLEASVVIPSSVSLAIFPVFAKLHEQSLSKIHSLYRKSILIMGFLGLLVSLVFILVLPELIKFVLPTYMPSVDVVKILALSVPFMFIHVAAAQVILSSETHLKGLVILSFIPLILNSLLNLILIPLFGYIGASWVTVTTDVLSMILLLTFLHLVVFKHAK